MAATTAIATTMAPSADLHPKNSLDFIWRVRKDSSSDSPFSLKKLVTKRRRNHSVPDRPTIEQSNAALPVPPPPLPPKDEDAMERLSFSSSMYAAVIHPLRNSQAHTSLSYLSHVNVSTHEVDKPPYPIVNQYLIEVPPFRLRPHSPPRVMSPAEKARQRLEAEREREFEALVALQEEDQRQARLKLEKEEILRRSQEEEMRRKARTELDLRRAASKRRERERLEHEAEEIRIKELEKRKMADRERRLLLSQKWQAWREEHDRRRAVINSTKIDQQRQTHEQKRAKRRELYERLKAQGTGGLVYTGWVSIQMPQTMTWKRRYFTLNETALQLYKTHTDLTQAIDIIQIANIGDVRDAGDVSEEEPEFIPFSFLLEEVEGGCWSMFTDNQETKDTLIAVLVHAAGLGGSGLNNNSTSSSSSSGFFSRIPRFAAN